MNAEKINSVAEYMYTHEDVARFFPSLMIRRMSWIDKLLHSACLEYSFDVIFDETEDELPTAEFTIQSVEDEDNELTMFLTNLRTIEFFGQTRCADIYSGEDIIHKMVSTVSGESMGLIFFAPGVEYDDDFVSITPVFTLPISAHEVELPVLESLIPTLFSEHQRFLDETEVFEDMINPEKRAENPLELSQRHGVDTLEKDGWPKEAFQPGKVHNCTLDLENIEEDAEELDKPILSVLEDMDDSTMLFEELKKYIRNVDEIIHELDQILKEEGLPFA